jgi:hypothetical protein
MFEKWPTCVGDRGCRKGVMFEFRRLNNGLRLILVPMGGVESFAAEIVVGVGSRDESDDLAGLAHLTEHVVLRGSETYPNQDMIESMGGLKNGWTSKDATLVIDDGGEVEAIGEDLVDIGGGVAIDEKQADDGPENNEAGEKDDFRENRKNGVLEFEDRKT